jgi:hypothetical protein
MPGFDIQGQIAFKNLSGKSQTESGKGVVNESIGFGFDVPSFNIMMDRLSPTASLSVTEGTAVRVTGALIEVFGSNNKSYGTFWPSSPPSGIDTKTGQSFVYGVGSLEGISSGQVMTNLISDSFGVSYQAIPKTLLGEVIPPLDVRDWIYQYNSGIFYQHAPQLSNTNPATIEVYYYIGDRLLSQSSKNTQTNIRVSATSSINTTSEDVYFATYSTPTISTYSTNYLFLVDFTKTNLSSTVSLNVSGIGTTSLVKYTKDGPISLSPGDIIGSTGGVSGQIYYLVYNNGVFEYYQKNPLSDSSSFTNPVDTSFQVGGIEIGSQFQSVTFQEMMKDFLYPNQMGNFTGFTVSNNFGQVLRYEVGDSLPRNVYTFSWGVSNDGDFINSSLSLSIENVQVFTQSTGNSGPYGFLISTISNITDAITTFKVSLTRNNGTVISKFLDIPWMWKVYHGSSTWSSLTASQVFALSSTLATQSIGSWTLSGDGYKYIAFPEDNSYNFNSISHKGLPLVMAGTVSGYSYSYADVNYLFVTVSNTYGISKQYKVYRSKNQIGATISVNLS